MRERSTEIERGRRVTRPEGLESLSANVLIPFIMGAGLGLLFMLALYLLDVGLIPVALAIGAEELVIDG